ncbi:MAG: glycosyltransferase family 4 protein [Armatimonadota bacterium]
MKVLIVTNMFPTEKKPFFGIFVKEQYEEILKQGINADLFFIDASKGKTAYLKAIFEMRKKIKNNNYDLIHAHYVFSGWVARFQKKLPIVVTSHGSDTEGSHGLLLKLLFPLVDAVTITSKQNQQRIGLLNTHLLPCGVNTDIFKYTSRDDARKKLGIDLADNIMLYVGRDDPLKRLDIIKDSYNIVRKDFPNTKLILGTNIDHQLIPLYMNAADVFVFASETEGSPVVIKEAIACNLPIVSVDVGDVVEQIRDIDNCYICERTPESMAIYLKKVFESNCRSNGNQYLNRISNKVIVEKLIGIYEGLIEKTKK